MENAIRTISLFLLMISGVISYSQYSTEEADSLLNNLNEGLYSNRVKAISLCNQLIPFYENLGDTCKQIKVITKLARLETSSAQFEKSLSTLIEAQRLYDVSACAMNTRIEILLAYSSLYDGLGDYKQADSVALLGIELFDHSDSDKSNLIKLYMNVDFNYESFDSVLLYLDTAYNLAVVYDKPILQEKILINIGVAYANNDNFPEALKYMQRAVPLVRQRNALGTLGSLYNNLAGLSEDPELMLMYVDSALYYAYETENLADIQLYTENKAYFYSTIGNYEDGYNELYESMVLKDSLLNTRRIEAIAEMRQKYEAEKTSNEIKTLRLEKLNTEVENLNYRRTQITLLVIVIFVLTLAIFFAYNFLTARKNRNRLSKKNVEIEKARQLSDELLLNILPAEIAEELKEKGQADARKFDHATILFTDFKEFTQVSEKLSATELVSKINYCFKGFDNIMDKYGIEKIKTIGDAYMAAGGLPAPSNKSVKNTVLAGLEMQEFIINRKRELDLEGKIAFEMRVGIHTGPVVAGIVGVKKFQYDVWGDTVNTASRIESNSEEGKVNISDETYEMIKDDPTFAFESRGKIAVKGKGEIEMYFVSLAE